MYSPIRTPSHTHHEQLIPHCHYPHHLTNHLQPLHIHQPSPWIYNYPVENSLRQSYALQNGLSEVYHTHDKFMVKLDVADYSPDELVVKSVDDFLHVEGNHEEKADEHGFITRSFKRRYILPPDVDKDDVQVDCEIGVDGVLKICINKKMLASTGKEKVHEIKSK